MKPLRLVSATRLSETAFWQHSLLGKSLLAMPEQLRPELCIRFDNDGARKVGLPVVYNRAIDTCPKDRNLLLVHDDVYLHDVFLLHRVQDGLTSADVIGLAGSRHSDLEQPSWCLCFDPELNGLGFQKQAGIVMSGAVSHYQDATGLLGHHAPPIAPTVQYGSLSEPCDLLDGLFLAVKPDRLRARRVRFDEQFDFHLYDLDFCRSARAARLRLWTWPILVSHGSGGNFASAEWKDAARRYLDKWRADSLGDLAPATTPSPTPHPSGASP